MKKWGAARWFILLSAVLFLTGENAFPADGAGLAVAVVVPVAVTLYEAGGADARDDEVLYGMSGTAGGPPDAEGRLPVTTGYGYRVRLRKGDFLEESRLPASWREAPSHVVTASFADILPRPDLKAYPPKITVPRGALLRAKVLDEEHHAVSLHDGTTGFVRSSQIRPLRRWQEADEATNRRRVAEDALSYRGVPYRWGGKTPAGIDCSGLASMVYLLNGLDIYRNSRPRAGYPVALLHIEAAPDAGFGPAVLARAKPGDMIYWDGHQGVYLGDGRYVHANGATYETSVHSLFGDDASYLDKYADPRTILTWGTVYPERPDRLPVRRFVALPTGEAGRYRFFARLDGYAPTSAVLYPEGKGEGKPVIRIADPGEMVHGVMDGANAGAPEYRYPRPGRYRPVVEFANAEGWLPGGDPITSGEVAMPEPVVVPDAVATAGK